MKAQSLLMYLTAAMLLWVSSAAAAVPRLINYQGYLTDSGGVPVDGQHDLTFVIYADSAQGAQSLWTEVHSNVDVSAGLFNVILGATATLLDSLFAGQERWLGITVDSDPEMTPRMRLTSVPWALRAAVADSAVAVAGGGGGGGGDITGVYPMDGLWSPDPGDAGEVHLFVRAVPGSGLSVDPVDGVKIETEGVTADKIAPGAISTAKLDSASVTGAKLATEAVSTAALATAAVTNDKLSSYAVADTNLRANAVTSEKLLDGAVNREKLLDFAVTAAKIDTNAVTSIKIQDATIQFADIAPNGASEGQVMKYVGGQWVARDDSVGGAGAIEGVWGGTGLTGGASSGSVTLAVDFGGSGADTTVARSDHHHDAAYVNEGQDSSVTSAMLVDGTILFADIGQNGAADGQVMKWSDASAAWVAANDSVGSGGSGGGGWTDDGGVVRLETAADSVGIGTATPAAKLDVAGSIRASGKATIGPLHTNTGPNAFVAGEANEATATHAAIGGGGFNCARGDYSVVSGGGGSAPSDSNSAVGNYCVVGGGSRNVAGNLYGPPEEGVYATVGGGRANQALGEYATIGGGAENTAGPGGGGPEDPGDYATIGGGRYNFALGRYAVVGGGGTDAGPFGNRAQTDYSVVGGGERNTAGDGPSSANTHATVGGGGHNNARGRYATVGGGIENDAGGEASVVGGGAQNHAPGDSSSIGGGSENLASGLHSAVGGGARNTASGLHSVVGGGRDNAAGDEFATVPGGRYNEATGVCSFAAGNTAKARHEGSVVISAWRFSPASDSVASGIDEQMVLRAHNGFYLTDRSEQAPTSPAGFLETSTGAWLSMSGQWQDNCDRARKENFTGVDTGEILEKVARLPVTEWNYIVDDDGTRHIGPVAQDFHAAFGIGYGDQSIAALDVGGVSLAAVQELVKRNDAQRAEIDELREQVSELRDLVQALLANERRPGAERR